MPVAREETRDSAEYAEMLAEVFVEALKKSVDAACACDHEVTPALTECLRYVYLHGPSPIRQIAAGLEISLSAASQLVERLVKKELVTRRDNEEDRRLSRVELTEQGEEHVRLTRRRLTEWFDAIYDGMSPAQKKSFREGLEAFLRIALASEDNPDRACTRCGIEHTASCVVSKVKSRRVAATEKEGVKR